MGLEKDGFIRSITKIRKDTRPGKRHTQMRNPRSFLRHWLLPGWSFFLFLQWRFFSLKGGGVCVTVRDWFGYWPKTRRFADFSFVLCYLLLFFFFCANFRDRFEP